jgi:hypothetical protein
LSRKPLLQCGPCRASIQDEINTGLDSATLHSVVTFLALVSAWLLDASTQKSPKMHRF